MTIKVTHHRVDDIPYTRYENDHFEPKPLLFFFHGFTSNKDEGIMGRGHTLAELGYTVIALDAYGHGQRFDETVIGGTASQKYRHLIDIIIRTADDARHLYEQHLSHDSTLKEDPYTAYGVSMGAAIAFLLAKNHQQCQTVVSIVGSPSLYALYDYKRQVFNWACDEAFLEKMAHYKAIDPLLHAENFCDKAIFFGCGINDEVVPLKYAQALYNGCASQHHTFKSYDVGHTSNEAMLADARTFLHNILNNQ